jgi:hypothetical protein
LRELIGLVENTAPELWRIAIKQVYVGAVQNIVMGVFGTWGGIKLAGAAKRSWEKYQESTSFSSDDMSALLIGLVAVIVLGIAANVGLRAIGQFINPEFYAIELLINYVK